MTLGACSLQTPIHARHRLGMYICTIPTFTGGGSAAAPRSAWASTSRDPAERAGGYADWYAASLTTGTSMCLSSTSNNRAAIDTDTLN
jgi:hypothetical protein